MKRTKITDLTELKIVAASIYDADFLLKFQPLYVPGLLSDVKFDKLMRWSISYFDLYDKVPGHHIQDLLLQEMDTENVSEEESKLIARVIKRVTELWEKGLQRDYLLDKARTIFQKKALETLTKSIETSGVEDALRQVEQFTVPTGDITYIEPFENLDLFEKALANRAEPLYKMPGALGEMMNNYLTRDAFVSFLAPEKRGKTWWLFYHALKAIQSRKKVLLICCGDMSEDQTLRRIGQMLSERPVYEHEVGKEILLPVMDCQKNQENTCGSIHRSCQKLLLNEVDEKPEWFDAPKGYKPCTVCKGKRTFPEETWFKPVVPKHILDASIIKKKINSLKKRSGGKSFRVEIHPNTTLTVSGIDRMLRTYKREGFIPDVVIIDYADILAQEGATKDFRHGENEKWKALRRLSQVHKCCLITATQADAASYSAKNLTLTNFSEDKRKFAHTTAFFAINEDEEDRSAKCQRIGTLLLREGDFNIHKQVRVLQCRALGRVYLDSYWTMCYDK